MKKTLLVCFGAMALVFSACSPEAVTPKTSLVQNTQTGVSGTPESVVLGTTDGPVVDVRTLNLNVPTNSKQAYLDWMKANAPQGESEKFQALRWDRVQKIIDFKELKMDRPKVVQAVLRTPREEFARPMNANRVYDNAALGIGHGVTISGPHIVSKMTYELDPQPDDKILEIGTGSGYQSAVLSWLSNHVYSIEIIKPLGEETMVYYNKLKERYPQLANVKAKIADGYYGWEEYAPFDKIIVTAGLDHIPPALLKQLKPNGIMLIPIGTPAKQTLMKIVKKVAADGTVSVTREDVYQGRVKDTATTFVPFTNQQGGTHYKK